MCLLSYYPSGVIPDRERIFQGSKINADGCGFAISTSAGLLVRRGKNALQMVDLFCAKRKQYSDGPALFHSRLITAGGAGEENLHPFWVNDTTVIAHNGHLFDVPEDNSCSDTFIFATEILPPMLRYSTMEQIERYLGSSNRVVIISDKGESHLLNGQTGIWMGDEWHSGSDFLPAGPASDDPSWAADLEYKEAHLLYRKLGNIILQLNPDYRDDIRREFQQMRGDLLAVTHLHTGAPDRRIDLEIRA